MEDTTGQVLAGEYDSEPDVLEVKRTADGWVGRWADELLRAETVRLFGGAWLPLPFTSGAQLADLVRFYSGGRAMVRATVVPARTPASRLVKGQGWSWDDEDAS